jgi:hypothetical protein
MENKSIEYKIYNDNTNELAGLIHIEENNTYAEKYADNVPILFGLFGEIEHPSESSIMAFIEGRVIPRDRQGLGEILKSAGLMEYDVHKMIELNQGRITDDYYRLERVQ